MKTIIKRLEHLEEQLRPKHHDGNYTFEELCREYWRLDNTGFRKIAQREASCVYFIAQFEGEDLEARSRMRGR